MFQGGLLSLGVFGLGIINGEFGFGGPCPVDMVRFYVRRIEMCKGAGNQIAPIALRLKLGLRLIVVIVTRLKQD